MQKVELPRSRCSADLCFFVGVSSLVFLRGVSSSAFLRGVSSLAFLRRCSSLSVLSSVPGAVVLPCPQYQVRVCSLVPRPFRCGVVMLVMVGDNIVVSAWCWDRCFE